MGYTVGLDIGVASVGVAVLDENDNIVEAVSNIFDEADTSNNKVRRTLREGRRTKRRQKTRIEDFKQLWETSGYIIPHKLHLNIIELRNKGLTELLSLDELYCVLLSMIKHRGISYLEDADDGEKGNAYKKGLAFNEKQLKEKMPCEIQLERMKKYGKYHGEFIIEINDEKEYQSNVFTTKAYKKELEKIFETQRCNGNKINTKFIEKYMEIYERKREYYIGPGNEKSRTDYGIYTTRTDEEGNFIDEKNIFGKLIGKCSVYPEEYRASSASYTAQEFNLLNDLNNLKINNEKLTEFQKKEIVEIIKDASSVNMRKIIKKVIDEDIEQYSGARIDKKGKEIYHTFEIYRKLKKELKTINVDIDSFTREELDKTMDILTLNTERESIVKAFDEQKFVYEENLIKKLIEFRKNNQRLFSGWHSFSYKAMLQLIPVMYEESKEQMQLLTEMNVFKSKKEKYVNYKYIPENEVVKEIYNPVVVKSIRTTVKILNALIKKYGYPESVVIEMPRDKNSDDEKEKIDMNQKKNQEEYEKILNKIYDEKGIEITNKDYKKQKKLVLKLKLWNEQEGLCLYSGKKIAIEDLLNHPEFFEIDHIIPKSISLDDSRSNKVLVYKTENSIKGNDTPYHYLTRINGKWGFDEYKANVLELRRRGKIDDKKVNNLLCMEDITKIDVVKGFINRNLNDTRYASRVVLNEMQSFFESRKYCNTKVKVIRGSLTYQMRQDLHLKKNREESYSHHAVDAMLIAFSQKGYEAYRKIQKDCYDFETGEILDKEKWNKYIDDDEFDDILYKERMNEIRKKIIEAEEKVKYNYKIDKKCNRGLCNQTIYGTREKDGKIHKISSYNIYDDKECNSLKKMINSGKGSDLLMYNNDPKTYRDMLKILETYSSEKNPFVAYNKETGDYFRKYSKNHNGPKVEKVKYYSGQINSCIDISHKYGHAKNSKKVVLVSLNPYRTDVYYDNDTGKYYLVGVKYNHIKCVGNKYVIDSETYNELLRKEGVLNSDENLEDLNSKNITYKFSLYKNDIIQYEKGGEYYTERFLSRIKEQKNLIETKPINKPNFQRKNKKGEWENTRNQIALAKTKYVGKLVTDVLGNCYIVNIEKFSASVNF